MRTSLLKRFSAGIMAVATAATLWVGVGAETVPSAVTYGGFRITGITADGTPVTTYSADATTGTIAIPYNAMDADDDIVVTATYTPAAGTMLADVSATQVTGLADSTPIGASELFTATDDFVPFIAALDTANAQRKVTDIYTANQAVRTITFTLSAKANIAAGGTAYVKLGNSLTTADDGMTNVAFWSSFTARRQVALANVNLTDNIITLYYDLTAPSDLWKFSTDTLPTITIGMLTQAALDADQTIYSTPDVSYYSTGVVSANGKTVKLNGTDYTVNFVTAAIQHINENTLLTNTTIKSKMAYTQTLSIGGSDYTYNKDTNYTGLISGTTLTFQKVTTLTGTGTVTFKGAYLYADQSFTVQAADLKDGVTVQLVYKDGTTSNVTVKANGVGITKPSTTFFGSTLQNDTAAIGDNKKRYTFLIDSAASTKYPYSIDITKVGMDIINISLVNDVIPATLQVKVESKVIAGGSKTVDIDFYNQVFPIELTDGSFYYLSVNLSSLKNNLLPVTKFDFIGIASSNINLIPLMTWDQSKLETNKVLYFDYCGTMTDRVTYSGVLEDGTTDKIFPTTSYYQPNTKYDSAYWFYVRWTVGDELFGTSVKFTRATTTFDIKDATTGTMVTYVAAMINSKQEVIGTATNSTMGGQCDVKIDTGEYTQKWKQASAAEQFVKDGSATRTKGKINITSYYTGTIDLNADYVILTLRLPKGAKISMDPASGDIKSYEELQVYEGTAGNTTPDGLVDYVVKLMYREIYTGSNTVGTSTLRVEYPMTNKDNKASSDAYKDYVVTTTWTAKSYIAEKKVTMAGITVPSAIVAPPETSSASSVAASSAASTATSSAAASSSSLPKNPDTGVPFNSLAYVVTIAASAIGGVSTMILRRK